MRNPYVTRIIDATLLPTAALGCLLSVGMVTDWVWRSTSGEVNRPATKPSAIVLNLPRGSGYTLEARRAGGTLWLVMDTHRASEPGDGTEMHVIDQPAHEADIMVSVTAPLPRVETRAQADERIGYNGDL